MSRVGSLSSHASFASGGGSGRGRRGSVSERMKEFNQKQKETKDSSKENQRRSPGGRGRTRPVEESVNRRVQDQDRDAEESVNRNKSDRSDRLGRVKSNINWSEPEQLHGVLLDPRRQPLLMYVQVIPSFLPLLFGRSERKSSP